MYPDLKDVGLRIKKARIARGFTQTELAEKLDIAPPYLSNIENGRANFSVFILMHLTEVLQVSADSLLRTNVPASTIIYSNEIEKVVDGCSPAELDAMLKTLKNMTCGYFLLWRPFHIIAAVLSADRTRSKSAKTGESIVLHSCTLDGIG